MSVQRGPTTVSKCALTLMGHMNVSVKVDIDRPTMEEIAQVYEVQ